MAKKTKLFDQPLIQDVTGYRFPVRKEDEDDPKNILGENLKLPQHYTKQELSTSGGAIVHRDNISPEITIPDNSINKFPSIGVYRDYRDVIPLSYCKEKAALVPIVSNQNPLAVIFLDSESLQIGETYRVLGTGSIVHNTVVYNVNDEFTASATTFSVNSGSPEIALGTQHSEFGDCSQIYAPQIIEVGDYYYMYYAGNTQKYKTLGYTLDALGNMTAVVGFIESLKNNSDYGRNDQVFLAYKLKLDGLAGGKWEKWNNGRLPVLGISGEYSGENDASNSWFRNVFHNGTQWVMFYTGDSSLDGAVHSPHPCIATSLDGINWTKLGAITTSDIANLNFGTMFYANNKYYLFIPNSSQTSVMLYSNTDLITTGWTQVFSNLSTGYGWNFSLSVFDNIVYLGIKQNSNNNDMFLFSCPVTDIETAGNWVNEGVLYSHTGITAKTLDDENKSNGSIPCYHNIARDSENKWVVFYTYYKRSMARPPYVAETAIRSFSFSNTKPIPAT